MLVYTKNSGPKLLSVNITVGDIGLNFVTCEQTLGLRNFCRSNIVMVRVFIKVD